MKKVISVVLAAVMLVGLFAPSVYASGGGDQNFVTEYPTLHICGNGNWIFDKNGSVVWDGGVDVLPTVLDALPDYLEKLSLAILTDEWDDYCDSLVETIGACYTPFKLDEKGEASNGTYAPTYLNKTDWAPADEYLYSEYVFDFRLDPYENARLMHEYINMIKQQTGAEKVNLESRCIGAELPIAYIDLYGDEDIAGISLTAGANNGAYLFECILSGRMNFDAGSIADFVTMVNSEDYGFDQDLLQTFLVVANTVNALDLPIGTVKMIFEKVKENVIPRILLEGYATFPSYWGMVSDEYFEDAINFVFGDENDEKRTTYAGLLDKIYNYHNNAFKNQVANIQSFIDNGGKFVNIAKYNVNVIPVCEDNNRLTDIWFGTDEESFGAICAKTNGTLGENYVQAVDDGHNHLSPDKMIDASTCAFPEYTWFVRDSYHDNYGGDLEMLVLAAFNYDGQMTVFDNENYPQWLQETTPSHFVPMTTETESKNKSGEKLNFLQKFIRFLKALIEFVKGLFDK